MQKCEKFKVGETLKNDIGRKLNIMVDRINRDIKGDGKSIIVSEFGNTVSISAIRRGGGGGGGGGSSEYNGYFKVIIDPADDTKIKIIDGLNPSSGTCGYTDLGVVSSVSITKQVGTLFLNASYVDNAYALSFSFTQGDAYFVIASITADGIIQRWMAGDIYFTSRYFA